MMHLPVNIASKAFFDSFSDLAVSCPVITEVIKEFSKLVIMHNHGEELCEFNGRLLPYSSTAAVETCGVTQ